jgi:hypothetical protein
LIKRLNQALDRRGANHNVSLAGNVEVPAGDVRLNWLIPIGDEHKSKYGAKPSLILFLFIHYLFLDKLKETYK